MQGLRASVVRHFAWGVSAPRWEHSECGDVVGSSEGFSLETFVKGRWLSPLSEPDCVKKSDGVRWLRGERRSEDGVLSFCFAVPSLTSGLS